MPSDAARILIAGGGIGGLALAIALSRRGIASTVFEARPRFDEAGAGIQIGPNGVRVLRSIGVADRLAPLAGKPRSILVHCAMSGSLLTELPLGDWIAARHGAPYWTLHRQDLHAALLATAETSPSIEIVTGAPVARIARCAAGVEAGTQSGATRTGRALIGADGLWSAVRTHVVGDGSGDLPFSGKTASRTVLPAARVSAGIPTASVGIWLGPSAHVVHYPVRDGAEIALVVILDEDWQGREWSSPASREFLLERLSGRSTRLRALVEAGEPWRKWALFDPPPFATWSRGPVALLGDAAHPVLPFLAQGGVLALEDAAALAALLDADSGPIDDTLQRYQQARKARADRVRNESRNNGRIYHSCGPAAVARDLALRLVPPALLMARYDWLYGWRAPGDA